MRTRLGKAILTSGNAAPNPNGPDVHRLRNIICEYWKDNRSTNPARSFALSGNATYVAVYAQG